MKNTKKIKKAAVFQNTPLPWSDLFHCARIPEVMAHIVRVREICRKYKIPAPSWMFGIRDKATKAPSYSEQHLISFLVNLGLYDRLVRLQGVPDFLIGDSPALLVAGKIKNYEKTILSILGDKSTNFLAQKPLRIYYKKADRFVMLYFSQAGGDSVLKNIVNEYHIKKLVLVAPFVLGKMKTALANKKLPCAVDLMVEKDPQLAWFWPILKRKTLGQSRKTFTSRMYPQDMGFA